MNELVVDPNIRLCVFVPIVLITFLLGLLRHYVFIYCTNQNKPTLSQVEGTQAILRAGLLRTNGKYLTAESFAIRKSFFNDVENGYFKTNQRLAQPTNITNMLQNTLKGNFLNVIPMLIIGGWINVMFSGFVTTKVPFPLTLRFKPMLQCDIQLESLDASWVSSASWYILNIFGLRPIYDLILGENNEADSALMAYGSPDVASSVVDEPQTLFKAEWEALELTDYENELASANDDILQMALNNSGDSSHSFKDVLG